MLLVEPMFLLEQEIEKEVVHLAQWKPGNRLEGELYERGGSQL